jgi:hypothetical protein
MELHEIKKLLHNKRNGYQIEEVVHRMGVNFASYTIDKGLIYRELKKLNSPAKINDPKKKWANEQTELFQRKKSKCPKNT